MKEEDKKKIDEIIAGMTCPNNFRCAETGFEKLCKAQEVGLPEHRFLICEETNPETCTFSESYGAMKYGYFCHCPLREYLAKKLKK